MSVGHLYREDGGRKYHILYSVLKLRSGGRSAGAVAIHELDKPDDDTRLALRHKVATDGVELVWNDGGGASDLVIQTDAAARVFYVHNGKSTPLSSAPSWSLSDLTAQGEVAFLEGMLAKHLRPAGGT